MNTTIYFDRSTQLEVLQSCEGFIKSLREEHGVKFDEEHNYFSAAKSLKCDLFLEFPEQMTKSDRERVLKYLEARPQPIESLLVQKAINILDRVLYCLNDIHTSFSSLKEGYDGLGNKLKSASWFSEWLDLKSVLSSKCNLIQEIIKELNTETHNLKDAIYGIMPNGMIVAIQNQMVFELLEFCDSKFKYLSKGLHVSVADGLDYISLFGDLYSHLEKEMPTSYKSLSIAASNPRGNILATLEKLNSSLDVLAGEILRGKELHRLLRNSTWADAAAKDPFSKQMDIGIKGYIENLRQHAQELIPLIQQGQDGR